MSTKNNISKTIAASLGAGIMMWVTAGIYHNLIMPAVDDTIHPHHEGLAIGLIAYILLGGFMTYFYQNSIDLSDTLGKGIKIGAIIGILWVFPHGLTMAAVHETSISYQITNAMYHVIEQGIGGAVVFLIYRSFAKRSRHDSTSS